MGANIGANLSQYNYSDLNQGANATTNNPTTASNTAPANPFNPQGRQFSRAYTETARPGYKEFGESGQYYQPIYQPQYTNYSTAPGFYSPGYGAFGGGGGFSAGFGGMFNPFMPQFSRPVQPTPAPSKPIPPDSAGPGTPPPPTTPNITPGSPTNTPISSPMTPVPGNMYDAFPAVTTGVYNGPADSVFTRPDTFGSQQQSTGIAAGGISNMRIQDLLNMLSRTQGM